MIYVPEFRKTLAKVRCPVLALFGEKDSIVDWRRTRALYEKTLGRDGSGRLTVRTFPRCNHNMRRCETGGFREDQTHRSRPACDGYLDEITQWLRAKVLHDRRWARATTAR